MALNMRVYFCSLHFILKLLQMVAASIILILILYESAAKGYTHLYKGEELSCLVCFVCLIMNLIIIILEACGVSCTCGGCTSRYTYQMYYLIMLFGFVAVSSVQIVAAVNTSHGDGAYHSRRCAAAAFVYLEVIFYSLCLWFGPSDHISVRVS